MQKRKYPNGVTPTKIETSAQGCVLTGREPAKKTDLHLSHDLKGRLHVSASSIHAMHVNPAQLMSPPNVWPRIEINGASLTMGSGPATSAQIRFCEFPEHRSLEIRCAFGGVDWTYSDFQRLSFDYASNTYAIRCHTWKTRTPSKNIEPTWISCQVEDSSQLEDVVGAMDDIAWLLNLATGRRVPLLRTEIWNENLLCELRLRPASLSRDSSEPSLLALHFPGDGPQALIARFLEFSLPPFKRTVEELPVFKRIVDLLAIARQQKMYDVKAMAVCTILECIRHRQGEALVKQGLAKKGKGNHFVTNSGRDEKEKPLGLKDLIVDFAKSKNISGWDEQFVVLRNSMFHEGMIPGTSPADRARCVNNCLHYCDRIALALLDWDKANGRYRPYNFHSLTGENEGGINLVNFVK